MTAMLSKSRFISGLQCELKLWNDAYRRELAAEPSEQQQARFALGSTVGVLARQRWPGGVTVGFQPWEREPALAETAALMADPAVPAIYEAAFLYANLYIRVDILARTAHGWELVEVKSATRPEKAVYLQDVAVQYWVLRGLGIPIARAGILVLDSSYVYPGGAHDLERLFRFHDAGEHCLEQLDWVGTEALRLHAVLARPEPPDIPIGEHCFRPYDCPYYAPCSAGIEFAQHPLGELYRLGQRQRNALQALGIETIPEIPDDFPLSEMQARIRRVLQTGEPWRSDELRRLLQEVKWPLYFLDFEAFAPAVPRYVGTRPYQAIPFQYSLHVQREAGAAPVHHEFLHTEPGDPRPILIEQLLADIGQSGSIVVYSGYERRVLNELARDFPDHAAALAPIRERLWDLLPVVQQHVYHADFRGSFSIKSVLPALLPEAGWSELAIAEGMSAVLEYERALDEADPAIRRQIFDALRAYCRQDTLAMVQLREALLG